MDPDDIPQNVTFDNSDILGTGRFGNVYAGKLKATGQKVAVKIVQKEGKYKREIEVLKEFQELEHQHLVRLLDYEDKKNVMIMTMEFCPFSDLSNYLKFRNITWKKNPLKECEIKNFLQQLIEGYYVLYRAKVIHRDLKPQNILLCQSGNEEPTIYPPEGIILKIADFGISRFLNESGVVLTVAGTPLYKAPEVNSQSYDYKVDLWSLGIIIIECLIGPKKFLEMSTTTSLWTFELFEPCLATLMISRDLYDLLTGLLQRTPSKRVDFDTLVKHKFLSMSTEFLEKFKNEGRNSNTSAHNNVSILHPQPSTIDSGPLAEERNRQENQDKPARHDFLRWAIEFAKEHKIEGNFERYNFFSTYAGLLYNSNREEDFVLRGKLMSLAFECLKKDKKEAPNSNASAQNNVSILHSQPSTSEMADSGPLEEEEIEEEMQVRKLFRCIDKGPCRMLPSGKPACEMCPMCHISACERRNVSYLEDATKNLQAGVCKPFLLGNVGGPCDRFKLPGGQVVCQLCPFCHTDHESNASAQSNVSTLLPQPSTSSMDVSRPVGGEKKQKMKGYEGAGSGSFFTWGKPDQSLGDVDYVDLREVMEVRRNKCC